MEISSAVQALSALAQEARLEVYRLLVRTGPQGLAAGEIARRLDVAPSTLSAQLQILTQAGLVRSDRQGRSIVYAADYATVQSLLAYLIEDCCQGRAEICGPLAGLLERVACCAPNLA